MSVFRRYATTLWRQPKHNQWHLRITHGRFHTSATRAIVKPYVLADIGEGGRTLPSPCFSDLLNNAGIKEVQIIQWFVEPEARVEQFDKICEVQSDKASTEVC